MRRVRDEQGSTVVTAIVLMSIMLIFGLSLMALVDQQQRESGKQRTRESSLNLNEGALYGQAFVLARNWPSASAGAGGAFPSSCTSAAATVTKCPDRDTLATANSTVPGRANFNAVDFKADSSWVTMVRDNGGTLTTDYDPAKADLAQSGCPVTPCTLDANNDRQLWVQVRALVRGRPRSTVALLKLETFKENFPRTAITAGSLHISNNGNHGGRPIVDNGGSQIAVRCDYHLSSCAGYESGQISNPSFVQLPASGSNALSPTTLERLKQRAIADGKFFSGCPGDDLAGAIVWVNDCTDYKGASSLITKPCQAPLSGQCINNVSSPGILIWHKGTAKLTGNATFVGLIYMANDSDGSGGLGADNGPVLEINGGFSVYGAVSVDGQGKLEIGSNADPNITYNPNVFNGLESYGTAGLVQNTWRELPPGS
ncbi:MAG: hypothetical protein ACRDLS_08560 [Solirubrobacteraceae bacterium]